MGREDQIDICEETQAQPFLPFTFDKVWGLETLNQAECLAVYEEGTLKLEALKSPPPLSSHSHSNARHSGCCLFTTTAPPRPPSTRSAATRATLWRVTELKRRAHHSWPRSEEEMPGGMEGGESADWGGWGLEEECEG